MAIMNTTSGIVYVKSISGNLTTTGSIVTGGNVVIPAGNAFYWNGSSFIDAPSNGVVRLTNATQTDFGRLQFGGTGVDKPALKRSGSDLIVRKADDSADSGLGLSSILIGGVRYYPHDSGGTLTFTTTP